MDEDRVDHLLVMLALLAPLALVLLGKWQATQTTWYVSPESGGYLADSFGDDVAIWLRAEHDDGANLYVVVDAACPCTQATLGILRRALTKSGRGGLQLQVRDIHASPVDDPAWSKVLAQIPSTPTLLATDGGRLVYAGPVTAGNFCTNDVQKVLGLSVLETTPEKPVLNVLDKGCYCPVARTSRSSVISDGAPSRLGGPQ